MRLKLNIPIDSKELQRETGIFCTEEAYKINYISTDSRLTQSKDLFFSLTQNENVFKEHLSNATKNGGYAAAESNSIEITTNTGRKLLLKFASYYKKLLPNLKYTVAITGSLGKTTTKEFVRILLSKKYKVHSTVENQNNEIGLAYTLLTAPISTEVLIVEIGMNHTGEISMLSKAVMPDISIITNVSSAHIGNLGSLEAIAKAKLEINEGMSENGITLVPYTEKLLADALNKNTVSTTCPKADFFLFPLALSASGSTFDFYSENTIITDQKIAIPGSHILTDLSFALSTAALLKLNNNQICDALKALSPDFLRQKFITVGRYKIYDDTYSSSPEAVLNMLKLLTLFDGQKSAFLGDMLELGKNSYSAHYNIGKEFYKLGFKKLYTFGKNASAIAQGARDAGLKDENIFENPDTSAPNVSAKQIAASYSGEIILFKASNAIHAERVFDFLKSDQK